MESDICSFSSLAIERKFTQWQVNWEHGKCRMLKKKKKKGCKHSLRKKKKKEISSFSKARGFRKGKKVVLHGPAYFPRGLTCGCIFKDAFIRFQHFQLNKFSTPWDFPEEKELISHRLNEAVYKRKCVSNLSLFLFPKFVGIKNS